MLPDPKIHPWYTRNIFAKVENCLAFAVCSSYPFLSWYLEWVWLGKSVHNHVPCKKLFACPWRFSGDGVPPVVVVPMDMTAPSTVGSSSVNVEGQIQQLTSRQRFAIRVGPHYGSGLQATVCNPSKAPTKSQGLCEVGIAERKSVRLCTRLERGGINDFIIG